MKGFCPLLKKRWPIKTKTLWQEACIRYLKSHRSNLNLWNRWCFHYIRQSINSLQRVRSETIIKMSNTEIVKWRQKCFKQSLKICKGQSDITKGLKGITQRLMITKAVFPKRGIRNKVMIGLSSLAQVPMIIKRFINRLKSMLNWTTTWPS